MHNEQVKKLNRKKRRMNRREKQSLPAESNKHLDLLLHRRVAGCKLEITSVSLLSNAFKSIQQKVSQYIQKPREICFTFVPFIVFIFCQVNIT